MIRPAAAATGPRIEIADIFRRHGDTYRRAHAGHLGRVERRVMSAIGRAGPRRSAATWRLRRLRHDTHRL